MNFLIRLFVVCRSSYYLQLEAPSETRISNATEAPSTALLATRAGRVAVVPSPSSQRFGQVRSGILTGGDSRGGHRTLSTVPFPAAPGGSRLGDAPRRQIFRVAQLLAVLLRFLSAPLELSKDSASIRAYVMLRALDRLLEATHSVEQFSDTARVDVA